MDDARKVLEQWREYWDKAVEGDEALKKLQDQTVSLATEALRSARLEVARMEAAAAGNLEEAKTSGRWILQEAVKYENEFFSTLKEGVLYALDHRGQSALVGGTLLLFALPATRVFLWRRTIGRFRSPEGMVQTAERRLENMKQSLEVLKNDSKKLQERAQLAEQEYVSGRSKLRATVSELRRSWGTAQREQNKAQGLKELLTELPTRDSVRLRSELAILRHDLRQQAAVLDRQTLRIARLGVPA